MTGAVRAAAVLTTHGRRDVVARRARARRGSGGRGAGVELVAAEEGAADVVVVLGGDGTMLRALRATLGTRDAGLRRSTSAGSASSRAPTATSSTRPSRACLAGDFRVVELCTLAAALRRRDGTPAVNDVVVTSSRPGRMVELGWEIGGEHLGDQPCDGMICCTPSGSTAYNLSNGGPVMMWGLDAMAMTFVAPHSLRARPLVVPRGLDLRIANRSPDCP